MDKKSTLHACLIMKTFAPKMQVIIHEESLCRKNNGRKMIEQEELEDDIDLPSCMERACIHLCQGQVYGNVIMSIFALLC